MKRIYSVLLVLALVFTTVVATANPFADVPFSHWAYDAVNKLAAKGLLQGYPDGTFKGEKHVTRYALAMVTAKMLANVEQMLESGVGSNLVTKSDLQTLEKLTVEFADELALLGVKVTALEDDMQVVKEDVATLKKDVEGIKDYMAKGGMEKVKLSGDILVRHMSLTHENDTANDNTRTYNQIRFQFKANIDENVTAVARWHMVDGSEMMVPGAGFPSIQEFGRYGNNGLVKGTRDNDDLGTEIDLAYLNVKDMFKFGGDFTFGRNFYATGHSLLISEYVDAVKYAKRAGDVDVGVYCIYDVHEGRDVDVEEGVDFRDLWGLTLGTKYRDHDLYLNFWAQDDPNLAGRLAGARPGKNIPTTNVPWDIDTDKKFAVEFGGKGPLGKTGHWDYDLGLVYTDYQLDFNETGVLNPEMQGWMGHVAVKWDSKKEWAAKLAYTMADDESTGAFAINNDRRYDDGIETPYEDISRGNTYFRRGLLNMSDIKLQVEYRPRNSKHYFRLAGDFLDEIDDSVSNDMVKMASAIKNEHSLGTSASAVDKAISDRYNNFLVPDPKATVITFEYRYQLAENTRIRLGYTAFDMTGDGAGEGNGLNVDPKLSFGGLSSKDWDYDMFWAEIYSRF